MRTPKLTRPLTLERPVRLPDSAGGYIEEWRAAGTIWAEVSPRTGREAMGPDVTLSRMSYRITVRAAPQGADSRPAAGERFREGDRSYEILAVTEADPAMKYLICFAEEEVAA